MKIGLILGTGMEHVVDGYIGQNILFGQSPYSSRSVQLQRAEIVGNEVLIAHRHWRTDGYGDPEFFLPHQLNSQELVYLMAVEFGAQAIISTSAVGGINQDKGPQLTPGCLVSPHDFVSFVGQPATFARPDFKHPTAFHRRPQLCRALAGLWAPSVQKGSWLVAANLTRGPSYETDAEIRFLRRQALVMMTMNTWVSEAQLAAEVGVHYAPLCVVTNLVGEEGDGQAVRDRAKTATIDVWSALFYLFSHLSNKVDLGQECGCARQPSVFTIVR